MGIRSILGEPTQEKKETFSPTSLPPQKDELILTNWSFYFIVQETSCLLMILLWIKITTVN